MGSKQIISALRKSKLFNELKDEELSPIVKLGHVEEYKAGETIYEQGSIGTKLYILSEGLVSLHRKFKLDDNRMASNKVYVMRESPYRRLMGGWCTLVGEQHVQMCSAVCDKPSKMIVLSCSDLREIIVKNSTIHIKILEKLVVILKDRLESSYAAMETL